jgi:hypothetical protein
VAETVAITFLYALGERVRWAGDPLGRWRVIARSYEESVVSRAVRYQLRRMSDTEDATAFEPDLAPLEDD